MSEEPHDNDVLGGNLRRLRTKRGYSLERLAAVAKVSRAMISQIELGQSSPTINILWKLAHALDVPFAALVSDKPKAGAHVLRAAESDRLVSEDGSFTSRPLFPFTKGNRVELYELTLAVGGIEHAEAHPRGTVENLVVESGVVEIEAAGEIHRLETGDSIIFAADVSHRYRNAGTSLARMYLVMTYAEVNR